MFEDIENDHVSGADEILIKSAGFLSNILEQIKDEYPLYKSLNVVRKAGLDLIQAQPRMAPLFNLLNHVLLISRNISDTKHLKQKCLEEIQTVLEISQTAKLSVFKHFSSLLDNKCTVMTYSRSSLVMFALEKYAEHRELSVILLESRPMYEGRAAAKQLVDKKIPVTLLTDAAMGEAVQKADLVVTGADAFDANTVINKTGTLVLCLLCKYFKTPIYALASTLKQLPDIHILPKEPLKPESEVWPDKPANVQVINNYFESVPLELFTGIVTNDGFYDSKDSSGITGAHIDPWLIENL